MERFLKPKFEKIITEKNKDSKNKATFRIEKLERGFGQTLGTSLRRTLLSSIPSLAPFAFEIKGVLHEFQSIKDCKEDVVEFVLNLKKILFKVDLSIINMDDVVEIKGSSKGNEFKAGDLVLPAGVEVANKNLVLAHTLKDKAIDLKLYAIFSKGYKTFEENSNLVKTRLGDIGKIISMDSIFSPIKSVNFNVEEVNPGESKVYERVILEVETKGNIKPEEAVVWASTILRNHYLCFDELSVIDETIKQDLFEEEKAKKEDNLQLSITIDELNLSVRSQNGLEKANIKTVGELINRPFSALKEIDNLGDKSVSEIVEAIQTLGLSFKPE
jgi:DNA-directed RNA polymerase subunit alpha